MFKANQHISKAILSGLLVTGVAGAAVFSAKPASAQMVIGGGGTCTPHPVSYEQYVPGQYNAYGNWIPSHYVTRSRMSTECNSYHPPVLTANLAGMWYTSDGATTYISGRVNNDDFWFTREGGSSAFGYARGNTITVPTWNLTGVVTNNSSRIIWSNGGRWSRYPNPIPNNPNFNIPIGNTGASINLNL
jgi:hypothetical protein